MHDCPGCQVPLHGHETYCPVCGLKQIIRLESKSAFLEEYKKNFNPLGLILIILLLGGGIFYAVQNSWIGQLIRRGPVVETEENNLSAPAAREKLESAILQNLTGLSKTCKFVYMAGEKTVDRNYPQAVELTIEVNLTDASKRKSIVEPVKALMVPGQINTIVLNDSHSHATITYSIAGGASGIDEAGQESEANVEKLDVDN